MKLAIVLMAVLALAAASYIKPTGDLKYFDESMLQKQKFFTEIVWKTWEPLELYFPEWALLGDHLEISEQSYTLWDKDMKYFAEMSKKSPQFPPRGVLFNLFNKRFLKSGKSLFKFFYYSKDFATLQKNICWARKFTNEGMFLYALQMFVMHHPEYQYVVLPPLYEMMPHMFYNGRFIYSLKDFDFKTHEAYEANFKKMDKHFKPYLQEHVDRHFDWNNLIFHYNTEKTILRDDVHMAEVAKYADFFKDVNMYWIKADYTDKYSVTNEHAKINYLTEDFDWNMFWYYFNLQYPAWMHGKDFKLDERRGEYFMFVVQQLLARYYQEGYSHGFNPIREFSLIHPVEYGYNPLLVSYSGVEFSSRPNYYNFINSGEYTFMNYMKAFETKISNVIAYGYYEMADGTKFYFNKPDAIEQIGLILQGSVDSLDRKFFGSFLGIYHVFASFGDDEDMISGRHMVEFMPNVLLQFETMMRDPLFYQIYTKVYGLYKYFKYNLGPYKREELYYPGVKITDVTTDKFVTYYDLSDSDVSVMFDRENFIKDGKFSWDTAFFGRRLRLNNKPFAITYNFESDKPQKIVFRTFIGPKFNEYGTPLSFNYLSQYFYEIDQFLFDASSGKNTYVRDSHHFYWTRKDHTTYFELYRYVMAAFEGKYQFPVDYDQNKFCGFPERLLLPRGWTGGMPMKLYVIATPFDESVKEYSYEEHDMYCGMEYDKHPYGFPLDRPIDELYFWTPNMYYKDISIYHLEDYHMSSEMKYFFSDKLYF